MYNKNGTQNQHGALFLKCFFTNYIGNFGPKYFFFNKSVSINWKYIEYNLNSAHDICTAFAIQTIFFGPNISLLFFCKSMSVYV